MTILSAPYADFASVMVNTAANVPMAVVVSGLPRLVITEDKNPPADEAVFYVAGDHDLTVYADYVVIRGPITLAAHNVRIFARRIGSEPSSAGAAAISVDGVAAAAATPAFTGRAGAGAAGSSGGHKAGGPGGTGAHGKAGTVGSVGRSGGTITLICEGFVAGTALALSSNGGTGGAGSDGQQGGQGGRGGDGVLWRETRRSGRSAVVSTFGSRGGNGGNGGPGGNAGPGGAGGNGGRVDVFSLMPVPASITSSVKAGAAGAAGRPGSGGPGGPGGAGKYKAAGGNGGKAAADGVTPAPGAGGKNGSAAGTSLGTGAYDRLAGLALGLMSDDLSCGPQWPGWCAMMLRVAKGFYLAADPVDNKIAFADTSVRIVWLYRLLRQFNPAPASFAHLGQGDVAQLHAIACEVVSLLARLNHRRDVFGHEYNFVPLASLDFYLNSLEAVYEAYRDVEGQYTTFLASLSQMQTAQQQLANALTTTGFMVSHLANQMRDVLDTLKPMPALLDKQYQAVLDQQQVLKDDIKDLKEAIEHKANCPLQNIFQAVQMCAFMPEAASTGQAAAIAGSIVGESVVSGIENVPLGAGGTMSRDYLVNQVDVYGAGVTSIQQGVIASGPFVSSSDPNGYKLAMSAQQLQAELTPYTALTEAQQTLADLHSYVDLVGVMNATILRYNTLVTQYVQMQSQAAQLQGRSASLQNQLQANFDPTLPQHTQYLSGLHDMLRDICIYQIYMVSRAYAFWAIKPYEGLYAALGRGDPGSIAAATVKATIGAVLAALADAKESFGRDAEPFPPKPPPGTLSRSGGIVIKVTDQKALQSLRDKGLMYFAVPAAMAGTTMDESPFAGKSNIRLYKARPWVAGATIGDRSKTTLTVTLAHTGTETLVAPGGDSMAFRHDPIGVSFTYDYTLPRSHPDAIQQDGDIGSSGGSDYALVSPFTIWRLALETQLNGASLDRTGITDVEIEFWGDSLPFRSTF